MGVVVEYEALHGGLLRMDEVITVEELRAGMEALGRRRRHAERRQLEATLEGSNDAMSGTSLVLTSN